MTTTSLTQTGQKATTTNSSNGTQLANPNAALNASDFINMMVTQLQNQDPLNPTSSSDMLAQMSQIGQLQSSTALNTSLQSMTLQSNVAAASNMIGKTVSGLDTNGAPLSGQVTSVHVANNAVSLELDNGKDLALASVTDVAPTTVTTASPSPAAPTTTK